MSQTRPKPRILTVAETHFGKLFASDPVAKARHNRIVAELRKIARPDVQACERSTRLTWHDLHEPTFYS
jgi:hypothetical protein